MATGDKLTFSGIIIARLDSRRLPGKALRNIDGMPLLSYVVERARRIKALSSLVLATTDRAVDDPLASFAEQSGLRIFRGQCDDVADRVLTCAKEVSADYFVRLNGDSPFLDPDLIHASSIECLNGFDLVSNLLCRLFPYGVSVEWIRTEALAAAYPLMKSYHREHFTQFFYEHPEKFGICSITRNGLPLNNVRLVVDTQDDLERMAKLMSLLRENKLSADYEAVVKCYFERWPRTREEVSKG
jgi:spore coat polysaccharide biosynthesis protein SpsF